MKEAIAGPGLVVKIVNSPIPKPGPDQVVIKVMTTGFNPKDWKMIDIWQMSINPGDDIAGIIHEIGANVHDLKVGDRVAGLHKAGALHGSFAEYAVAEANTTFIIPANTSFDEAATFPLTAHTAASGLYLELNLPPPWQPAVKKMPLIIWGAGSAVGAYAVQLATRSNIHPLICIAGESKTFVESLIDCTQGDIVLDYRDDVQTIKNGIQKASEGYEILHAIEGVSSTNSAQIMAEMLTPGGRIALVLFEKNYAKLPSHVTSQKYDVRAVHDIAPDFGFVFSRFLGRGLQQGWLKPHPYEAVPGGLHGAVTALKLLKEGKASAKKYVARVEDTT